MSTVNFSARIDKSKAKKIKVYLAKVDKTNAELMDHVIDNIEHLRPALDATTGRRK